MTFKTLLIGGVATLSLIACSGATDSVKDIAADTKNAASGAVDKAGDVMSNTGNAAKLEAILLTQDDKAKARFDSRNPKDTLMFFGIKPGMTVVEALPGRGWYSKILIPYLGDDGHLVGVDYAAEMWGEFSFATPEFLESKKTWPADWVAGAQEWRGGAEGNISAFAFGDRDTSMDGTADAVLFIRALHNVSRFESKGGYLTQAISDAHSLLKTGGVVGVVQHQGPESNDDTWADGNNGYLKKSKVIAHFEAAGFTFAGESDINANPKDVPTNEEGVWRLPPTLAGSKDNPEMKAKLEAIGESNRMTLLFKKT